MKLRFPISAPRRDDGTLVPAVLAGLLLVGTGLQLFWTGDESLPAEAVGRVAPVQLDIGALFDAPATVILAQPIFALNRGAIGAQGDSSASLPLGGAVVAGMASNGRGGQIFLRLPDGTIKALRRGEGFAGWRLAGWTSGSAQFVEERQKITVPFGNAAQAITAAKADDSDEDEHEE